MVSKTSIMLDEPCVCGETDDKCECPLGFCTIEDDDAVVQTNPPIQQKCYCELALQPGSDCSVVEWRPDDPEAFLIAIVKKLYGALRKDWGQGDEGHLCLELAICPAEAVWIAKALKANLRQESTKAAKP